MFNKYNNHIFEKNPTLTQSDEFGDLSNTEFNHNYSKEITKPGKFTELDEETIDFFEQQWKENGKKLYDNSGKIINPEGANIDEIVINSDQMKILCRKCWQLINPIAGKPINEIIPYVNEKFGHNFKNCFEPDEEVIDEYVTLRDAMIKAGIYGIVSKEQCEIIKKAFIETNSDEIHFHCVGTGYEVKSFQESGVFSKDEMPPIEAYDKDYMKENKYLPFISNIKKRNVNHRATNKNDKRILVVICNAEPYMWKDILNGMIFNSKIYTGLLIIGEVLTGHCIERETISNFVKCKWTFKNYWHEPGISYNDFNYNVELAALRKKYCKVDHNMSQVLLVNNSLINFDDKPFIKDIRLFEDVKTLSNIQEIIFLMLYNIHCLENYDISHYMNNRELGITSLAAKKYFDELPIDIVTRYFNALRKNKKEYITYLAFYFGNLHDLFKNFYVTCSKLSIRSDMTLKKAIFHCIKLTFDFYIKAQEDRFRKQKMNACIKYPACNVCFSKIKFQCEKCQAYYCDEQCRDIDNKYLNHAELCYYEIPIRLYIDGDIFMYFVDWKDYIDEGLFKQEIVKHHSEIDSVENLLFQVNGELQNELTVQNCKDMIDGKITVNLIMKTNSA